MTRACACWGLLAIGAVADIATTHVGLAAGYPEANPVAEPLIESGGLPELTILKAAAVLAVFLTWAWAGQEDLPGRNLPVGTLGVIWIGAASWTLAVISGVVA